MAGAAIVAVHREGAAAIPVMVPGFARPGTNQSIDGVVLTLALGGHRVARRMPGRRMRAKRHRYRRNTLQRQPEQQEPCNGEPE